jgi:fructose 1,6-bisphosphatase
MDIPPLFSVHLIVDAKNIDEFRGCKIIIGSVEISQKTFDDNYAIHPLRLDAFDELQEITDNLIIHQANHDKFTTLSFFGNLKVIGGSLHIIEVSYPRESIKNHAKII